MIYINKPDKFNNLNPNNFYVVSDFDQTITAGNSNTTFSLFAKSKLYPKEYIDERTKLFNHYRPLELNPNISYEERCQFSEEWHLASHKLMIKYKIKETDINQILNQNDSLILRNNVIDFIHFLNQNNIPLIICSAGIGNFIIKILKKYNCYSDNIFIHSNILHFNDNIIDNSPITIHSMVKNKIKLSLPFKNKINSKDYAIIIGDQLHDLEMAKYLPKKGIISFGFLESNIEDNYELFMNNYDVVLTDNESFKPIQKMLTKKDN